MQQPDEQESVVVEALRQKHVSNDNVVCALCIWSVTLIEC